MRSAHPGGESHAARALAAACRVFALAGGSILAALTLMVMVSVAGRALGRPIQGDFELVQVGGAVAIAFFLPYCQWRRANIIVDFFTSRASRRTQALLDAFGAFMYALVLGVVAWRGAVGAVAIRATNETTMIMGVPLWYGYGLMVPALALAAIVGLHTAAAMLRAR
jgi:TRAP-type C4-dicarboxylate transport system permease small subunit